MGIILARFRRPRLQPELITALWHRSIGWRRQDVFLRMLTALSTTDQELGSVLHTHAAHAANEDEAHFVMARFADKIGQFVGNLVEDGLISHPPELAAMCYTLGEQHAGYSREAFPEIWWTLWIDALLNQTGCGNAEEMKAFRFFLETVVHHMRQGYDKARSQMRAD